MNFINKNDNKNFSSSQDNLPHLKNEFKFEDEKILEAIIFASKEPVSINDLKKSCPFIEDINAALKNLTDVYSTRAVNLVRIKNTYAFRTLPYYSNYITHTIEKKVRLSKAAKETLAVIAYHQPVTRTEIEDIRGVSLYKGLMDTLLETNPTIDLSASSILKTDSLINFKGEKILLLFIFAKARNISIKEASNFLITFLSVFS